jgi:hypothetical protein
MPVHRTTVVLPVRLKRAVAELARQRGISMGALLRRVLEREVAAEGTGGSGHDPLLDDSAVFRGPSPKNTARDHDLFLYDK